MSTILGLSHAGTWFWLMAGALAALVIVFISTRNIGPDEVGLVRKRFGCKKLDAGNAVAFNGEAGYQARAADAGHPVQALAAL